MRNWLVKLSKIPEKPKKRHKKVEVPGIEPGSLAWQARILPLHHRCDASHDVNLGYIKLINDLSNFGFSCF